jgi:hypothetical protein
MLAVTGCAMQSNTVSPEQQATSRVYAPAPAAALAFDPPAIAGMPQLDLSRDGREAAAFVGYQDTTTTYYDLTQNDRQVLAGPDGSRLERQSVSETVGVSYR